MAFRVIARLDVKPPDLVKGVHMEGLRKLGNPETFAQSYYQQGADEINYQDIVASLYGRNSLGHLVTHTARASFVPLTVGGGVRSIDDAVTLVRSGADKICINTAAVDNPVLIGELAGLLGRQAVVVGIEATRISGTWMVMTDSGREHTGKPVEDWLDEIDALGAGEVLLSSIDHEGTMRGIDVALLDMARSKTSLPLIIHGGVGGPEDAVLAWREGADGVAIAAALHYRRTSIPSIKELLAAQGAEVRLCQ